MTAAEMASAPPTGSAGRWGPLWGSRASDWAATEAQQLPTYEEAIRRVGIGAGQRVLDVGCGSGAFLRAAADRGADVSGLDASEALLEIARRRVPDADLRLGDMERLPFEDAEFDIVTGFNSFFFASDMTAALREAARVAKDGAPVVVQVWGRPERCALDALKQAAAPFLPPPDPDAPRGSALWRPGVLEEIATAAGLVPAETFDVTWAFRYEDEDELGCAMLSAGGLAQVVGPAREGALREAIVEALEPYRLRSGAYQLDNEWHYLVARTG